MSVTEAGLKEVAALKALRSLNLSHCKGVTEAGLRELGALKALRWLDLRSCPGVTNPSIAELRKALPDCKIEH